MKLKFFMLLILGFALYSNQSHALAIRTDLINWLDHKQWPPTEPLPCESEKPSEEKPDEPTPCPGEPYEPGYHAGCCGGN